MAPRRKGPRKRQQSSSQTLVTATSVAVVIFTLCLCAFNFDLNDEFTAHPRLETCRTTCDERLQSAALESHVPSSASPSAADALFQLGDAAGARPPFQGRVDPPPSSYDGNDAHSAKQPAQARPRRLPTLIKILTGFGDERGPSAGGDDGPKPIIARLEKPDFMPQAQRRAGNEPLSHEETVQMAAAAAAAAVFSRSMRSFGDHRMHRVNAEWDAALRWIAGWDQQPARVPPSLDGGGAEPARAAGGASGGASQEGYDAFVDDLARMLESCISQCVEDESFGARLEKDGQGGVVAGGLSVGNVVLNSIFGWIVASSFPRISFGKLDVISSEIMFILCRTVQFVGSSLVLYALHSLWLLASPVLFEWYSSLGYTESPEWLLEHEEEIQRAKTARSRQKKKSRRKQAVKQAASRREPTPSSAVPQKEGRKPAKDQPKPDQSASRNESALDSVAVGGKPSRSSGTLVKESEPAVASDRGVLHPPAEIALPDSKDSVSGSQDSSEGVPSVISYSSTSASSSPSLKPIGHSEDQDIPFGATLQVPPQPTLRLNSQVGRQSPLFAPLAHSKALPVPTQDQRNEAARQLREFQNAQIQRIILQRKLSQISNGSRLSPTPPLSRGLISGSSFRSVGTESTVSGQRIKVLRPPPGLAHPSVAPSNPSAAPTNHVLPNHDDKAFLTDNELFLSKLLDDDEEDDKVEIPSSLEIGIECMSPESSLDPSAAPFVSSGKVSSTKPEKCAFLKAKDEQGDGWLSSPSELLKGNSPVRIKGVYGGSVW